MKSIVIFFTSVKAALLLLVISLSAFITVITVTSPLAVGPAGAMAAFLLMYSFFFSLFVVMVHVYYWLRFRNTLPHPVNSTAIGDANGAVQQRPRPSTRAISAAAAWAIAPIIILALRSIGQLDAVSIVLLLLFEGLATVYVFRR